MTVIETSKLLEKCMKFHYKKSRQKHCKSYEQAADKHRAWAEAIRSVIIPAPIGEPIAKVKQWIECSGCGAKATITYDSTTGVNPVSLHCKCGTITPYSEQRA